MQPFDLDEDGFPDRWYPQFSIADGALLGPGGEGGQEVTNDAFLAMQTSIRGILRVACGRHFLSKASAPAGRQRVGSDP